MCFMGAARGLLAVAGEGDAGRWAGGAFQVRSNDPIVFFPGVLKLSRKKLGEGGVKKHLAGRTTRSF